jgi:YVTN family beta-propeller protein
VANSGGNTVSVIDANTNTKIKDITVGERPSHMMQYNIDEIYVVNSNNRTVSVINRNNYHVENIRVGSDPEGIAFGPRTAFVANSGNNTVSAIDVITHNVTNIHVGRNPFAIAYDDNNRKLYVTNSGENTVSVITVINRTNYHVENIHVGGPHPDDIEFDGPNRIDVANRGNKSSPDTVSVIDDSNNTILRNIPVGPNGDVSIGCCPGYERKIVLNPANNSISVINGTHKEKDVTVGKAPVAAYIDHKNQRIYVANLLDNTVSVINGTTYAIVKNIPVGEGPSAIAGEGDTNTIYVANSGDNTVSVIDPEANKVVAKVKFKIEPFNSGHIECDNTTDKGKWNAPLNLSFYIYSGSECIAKPYQGFGFVSWQENLGRNSTQLINATTPPSNPLDSTLDFLNKILYMNADRPESKLNIAEFGNFTANFKALPPAIPPEYAATLFTVVATAFIGTWLTPVLIGWRKTKTQRKYFKECENQIGKLDKDAIEEKIIGYYVDGKISQEHRQLLDDKISQYYKKQNGSQRYGAPFA